MHKNQDVAQEIARVQDRADCQIIAEALIPPGDEWNTTARCLIRDTLDSLRRQGRASADNLNYQIRKAPAPSFVDLLANSESAVLARQGHEVIFSRVRVVACQYLPA